MVVNIEIVLQKYKSLLTKQLTYNEADRWAWSLMQLHDDRKLIFDPPLDEELLWELIGYLYGIDIPSMTDRNKTSRGDLDIIDFLKEKDLYRFIA